MWQPTGEQSEQKTKRANRIANPKELQNQISAALMRPGCFPRTELGDSLCAITPHTVSNGENSYETS